MNTYGEMETFFHKEVIKAYERMQDTLKSGNNIIQDTLSVRWYPCQKLLNFGIDPITGADMTNYKLLFSPLKSSDMLALYK